MDNTQQIVEWVMNLFGVSEETANKIILGVVIVTLAIAAYMLFAALKPSESAPPPDAALHERSH